MKRLSERLVAGGFLLALLMLCGVGLASYANAKKLTESRQWVEHTQQVLETLSQILSGMETTDRARRSYYFSRDEDDLASFQTSVQETNRALARVRQLTSDNFAQQRRLDKLVALIEDKFALSKQVVVLDQRTKPNQTNTNEAARNRVIKQTLSLQETIQTQLEAMDTVERVLLQQRLASSDTSVRRVVLVVSIAYVLSFGLLVSVFGLLQYEIRIRKRAESALQKHSEEIHDLYNKASCGYHSLDATGTFIQINDTELSWLGYTRDEVIRKKTFTELTTPQSQLVFQETFPKFKARGCISDVEFEIICKDGTVLPVSLSATAIRDAEGNFVMSRSTLFDVSDRKRAQAALQQANEQLEARVQARTAELSQVNALLRSELLDRKQAEHALSQSEKQLRLITDALPVLISYIDAEQRYRFNNRAYEHWFGYDWTRLRGQHLEDVLGESAYQAIKPYAEAALSGQNVSYESSVPYRAGGTRWVSAVYIPDFDARGAVKGYFALISDVTDRKQAEESLRESKERLSFALQTAEMGDWDLNLDDRTVQRSLRHDQIFGYDCLQSEWTYEKFLSHVLPDDRASIKAKFGSALLKGDIWDFECRIHRVDGALCWVWMRGHLYQNVQGETVRMLGVIADITDRKLAEEALRESEQRLNLAIEGSGMATWDINLKTGRSLWSAHHFQLLGYEPVPSGEATLSMWQRCIHPDDLDLVMQTAERTIQTRSPYRLEHRIQRVDNGQIVWLAAFGRILFDEAGQAVRFVGIILDISDRKQAELALQQAKDGLELQVQERTAALKQSNDDLQRSNQELEQFAYIASHDLQEPLRAITGYTQLLTQDYGDRLDDTAQGYGAYIVDGAKRMQQLIQDLLHYSRVGTRDLVFAATDCNEVLEQVLSNLQVAIAESNAAITYDPLPTVIADKNQLVQLFQNLVGNAIKFCRDEVPRVHISAKTEESGEPEGREILASSRHPSPHREAEASYTPHSTWLFSVRDHGIGIKPRYLERIFEIFKRLHTRTEFSGTGIGLAICKKIVDRHGGHIWALSEPGNGTTFHFTIPRSNPSEP